MIAYIIFNEDAPKHVVVGSSGNDADDDQFAEKVKAEMATEDPSSFWHIHRVPAEFSGV